jgi:putative ATP-dependent endonuclease of the OLD family
MLARVRIVNFRSIHDETVTLNSFGVLCGPNNAGKSNVLRAISLLLGPKWPPNAVSDADRSRDAAGGPIEIEARFDRPLTKVYRGQSYSVLGLRLTWRAPDDTEFVCLDSTGSVSTTSGGMTLFVDNDTRRQLSALHIEALRDLGDELRASQWTFLGRILSTIRDTLAQDAAFLTEHESRARRLTDHVKGPPILQLEQLMNEELRGITGFSSLSLAFEPPELMDSLKALRIRVREQPGTTENPAEELGQGFQSAVVIALVRSYQRMRQSEPLLLIEEPEAYLHPQARRAFNDILSRISEQGSYQILCTTHSTEFVDLAHPDRIYAVRKTQTDGTKVRRGDAAVQARPPSDHLKLATEFNLGLREVVFSKCAVLCEGPSEEWAIYEVLRKLGRNPDGESLSVRNVGSKENLPFFCEVVRSLGIPVVAVHDSDSGTAPATYHQGLNSRIEASAGGTACCWVASPDFETQHSIPQTERSKPRSSLAWARSLPQSEARRIFAPLIHAIDGTQRPATPGSGQPMVPASQPRAPGS